MAGGWIADDGDKNIVNDGISSKRTVIKANKDDTALFAKNNGPFDKLFGNIIPKVGDIKNEIIEPKPIGEDVSKIKEVNIKDSVKPKDIKTPNISVKPIDININGTLKLDMGNSNQVDIMKELKNNPNFMRELSRMLVEQMSSSLYGGKPKLDQNRFARFQS